jgi:glutathione S-transferase
LSRPQLYVFAISHFCEKARWALDALGLDYELRHLSPIAHFHETKRLGAPGSSLPLLVSGEQVVHGSGAILDWADSEVADPSRRLSPDPSLEAECRALEQRLDDVAGVHLRRCYYSEAIVDHPESVLPLFARNLAPSERQALEENWEVACRLMIAAMDLGPAQREESRRIVEQELDWLDGVLADGRRYLLGDRFSRADITAASLLAPASIPAEHPLHGLIDVPPLARADLARWRERQTLAWMREVYRAHR